MAQQDWVLGLPRPQLPEEGNVWVASASCQLQRSSPSDAPSLTHRVAGEWRGLSQGQGRAQPELRTPAGPHEHWTSLLPHSRQTEAELRSLWSPGEPRPEICAWQPWCVFLE